MSEHPKNQQEQDKHAPEPGHTFNRRDILKGFFSLPVFGVFGLEFWRKLSHERDKKTELLQKLELSQQAPALSTNMQSSSEHVRLGIVGFGARGEYLARMLGFAHPDWIASQQQAENSDRLTDYLEQADLNVSLAGICDVFDMRAERGLQAAHNPNHASGKGATVKRYATYHNMVASPDIDAVIVTTPDFHHAPVSIAAVDAGKHAYCEKGMTRIKTEVYAVESAVKAAQKSKNIKFQVGHQYTQNPVFHKAREVLDKRLLGQITMVETFTNRNTPHGAWVRHLDGNGNPKPGSAESIDWQEWLGEAPQVPFSLDRYYNWTKYWDYATGLSGQLMCHEYDAANNLLDLGIPASCVAAGGNYVFKDGREIPDIFQATFDFPEQEITMHYNASLASSKKRDRTIVGRDGWMEVGNSLKVFPDGNSARYAEAIRQHVVDPGTPMFYFQPGSNQLDAITSATEKHYATSGLLYTYQAGQRVDVSHLHLREWLNAIRHDTALSCPIERGFEVTIACHMATKAYRENRRVTWNPMKRRIV